VTNSNPGDEMTKVSMEFMMITTLRRMCSRSKESIMGYNCEEDKVLIPRHRADSSVRPRGEMKVEHTV
jgi:hypothetical protein